MIRLLAMLLVVTTASSLDAQRRNPNLALQDTTRRDVRPAFRPLRVAKWTTFLASTGTAGYGFAQNRVADRDYEELERLCEGSPALCEKMTGGDAYADVAMERRYQEIVKRDDRARLALLAGQLGILASVALFILDLPKNSTPEDIPYDPKPLRFGLGSDGSVHMKLQLRSGSF